MVSSSILAALAATIPLSLAVCPYMDNHAVARDVPRDGRHGAVPTDEFLSQYEIDDSNTYMTSDVGGPIEDQESLSVGERGPTLLEDFIFRQKIQHFDHERVPERGK